MQVVDERAPWRIVFTHGAEETDGLAIQIGTPHVLPGHGCSHAFVPLRVHLCVGHAVEIRVGQDPEPAIRGLPASRVDVGDGAGVRRTAFA